MNFSSTDVATDLKGMSSQPAEESWLARVLGRARLQRAVSTPKSLRL